MARNSEAFNLQPAVIARKTLMIEASSYQDCVEQVYKPSDLLVRELLAANPQKITCLRGAIQFPKNQIGSYCDLDVVVPGNKMVYLGTIRDAAQARENWVWFMETFRSFPEITDRLLKHGSMAIIRHQRRCDIPVAYKKLDRRALVEAVFKYFVTFFGDLVQSRQKMPVIKWLPSRQEARIENSIIQQAERLAKPQAHEERVKIYGFEIKSSFSS